jgi:hypothetical protein
VRSATVKRAVTSRRRVERGGKAKAGRKARGKRPLGDGQTARRRPQPARACCAARGSGGGVRCGLVGGLVEGWSGACGRGGASRVHTFADLCPVSCHTSGRWKGCHYNCSHLVWRRMDGRSGTTASGHEDGLFGAVYGYTNVRFACPVVQTMDMDMLPNTRNWGSRRRRKRTVPRFGSYKANVNTP